MEYSEWLGTHSSSLLKVSLTRRHGLAGPPRSLCDECCCALHSLEIDPTGMMGNEEMTDTYIEGLGQDGPCSLTET